MVWTRIDNQVRDRRTDAINAILVLDILKITLQLLRLRKNHCAEVNKPAEFFLIPTFYLDWINIPSEYLMEPYIEH